jgi:hypothetical protein
LLQIIAKEFIEKFNTLNNTIADVQIKHLLYGKPQKIKKCILHPVVDGGRIGLNINEEDIYITMDELLSIEINDNEYVIKSEVMELYIVL